MDGKPEPENMAVTEKEINQSSYCQDKDQRKQNGVNQIHLVGRKKRTQKFWQNSNQVIEEDGRQRSAKCCWFSPEDIPAPNLLEKQRGFERAVKHTKQQSAGKNSKPFAKSSELSSTIPRKINSSKNAGKIA